LGGKVGYGAGQYSTKLIPTKAQHLQTSTVSQKTEKIQVINFPISKSIAKSNQATQTC
jgi:hypothetical protein